MLRREEVTLNMENSKYLRNLCDKNTAWAKIQVVVNLWVDCIEDSAVGESQIATFKDMLTGFLMVEHDKGEVIKMEKEIFLKDGSVWYCSLRKAMDFSGISRNSFNAKIKRVTIYPSGDLKVEYSDKETGTKWM